jgi:hypothetical protein
MRSRKPWVFARRRLFGWNVRLLTRGLQKGNSATGRRGSSASMGQNGGRMPQGCQGFYNESEDSLWEPAGHKDLLRYGPSTNTVKPACVPPGTALDACWSADGLRLVRELAAGNAPRHAIIRLSCSVVENALMHRAARC